MAKFYCRTCKISLPSAMAKSHYSSWRHMEMVNEQQQFLPPQARTILVTNFFPRTTENQLGTYFSRFGRVLNVFYDRRWNHFNVEFSDIEEVGRAVDFNPHILNRKRLVVRAKAPWALDNRRGGNHYNKDRRKTGGRNEHYQGGFSSSNSWTSLRKISPSLNKRQTLEEQMKECKNTLLLSEENHSTREKIKNTLEAILRDSFPKSKVAVYGSSLTSLAMKKSNLNLAVSLDGQSFYADWHASFTNLFHRDHAPSVQLLQVGEITEEDISLLPRDGQLSFLFNLLGKGDFYKKKLCIYTPHSYITLLHQPSSLECAISVGQGHHIRTSELISLYVRHEPRFQTLVAALSFWARIQLDVLPYPVFVLLVVFHLQVRGVLPTVEALRSLADRTILINGVDCSFCEDLSKWPPPTNAQTCEELFKDFFSFYANFDFSLNMISTFYGKSIFKLDIQSQEDATTDIKVTSLTIQDPFDLSKNLTEEENCYHLMEKLKVTQEWVASPKFSTRTDKGLWGLPLLVDKFIPFRHYNKPHNHRRYSPTEITIPISLECVKHLGPLEELRSLSLQDLKDLWYEKVAHAIIQYLNKGYLFECEVMMDRLKEKPELQEFVYGPVENGKSEGLKRPHNENGEEEAEGEREAKKPCLDEGKAKKEESVEEQKSTEEKKSEEKPKESEATKADTEKAAKAEVEKTAKAEAEKAALAEPEKDAKAEAEKDAKAEAEKAAKAEAEKAAKAEAEKAAKAEAEKAAKKKEEEERNILFKGLFKVYYRTLNERKQALTKITSEQEEVEYLEQEHLISVYLAKESGKKPAVSAFEFEVTLRKVQNGVLSLLTATLSPKVYTGNFSFMAEMLQVRMSKIVEMILSKVKSKLNQASDEEAATAKKEEEPETKDEEEELLKEDGDEGEVKIEEEEEANLLKE